MEMKWEPVSIRVRRGRAIKPEGKWGHTVSAMENGLLYVVGGYSSYEGGRFTDGRHQTNDVFIFDNTSGKWSRPKLKGTPPTPRDSHTCTVVGKDLFVFGGTNGVETLNDLHVLDTAAQQWRTPPMSGDRPSPREGHGAALIDYSLFIFGGSRTFDEDGEQREECLNDLFIMDTRSFHWTKAETSGATPAPRDGFSCVAFKKMLIIFGGVDDCKLNTSYFGDVRVLNTDTMLWEELLTGADRPIPRAGHATVTLDRYLYVFGGYTDVQILTNDVYVLDLEYGTWEKGSPSGEEPCPRFAGAGACVDPKGGLFVFIGGCNKELQPLNDMFCLSIQSPAPLPVGNVDCHVQAESVLGNDPEEGCSISLVHGFCPGSYDPYDDLLCIHDQNIPAANSTTQSQIECHSGDTTVTASDMDLETPPQPFKAKVTRAFHSGYQIKANISGMSLRGLLFSNNFDVVRKSLIEEKDQRGMKRRATTNLSGQ